MISKEKEFRRNICKATSHDFDNFGACSRCDLYRYATELHDKLLDEFTGAVRTEVLIHQLHAYTTHILKNLTAQGEVLTFRNVQVLEHPHTRDLIVRYDAVPGGEIEFTRHELRLV